MYGKRRRPTPADLGVVVTTRLPPRRTGFRFPERSLSDFRAWESCRTIPLVCGASLRSSDSPAFAFRRCSILTSFHSHRLSRPRCQEPSRFLHSTSRRATRYCIYSQYPDPLTDMCRVVGSSHSPRVTHAHNTCHCVSEACCWSGRSSVAREPNSGAAVAQRIENQIEGQQYLSG
ncbi:hypothetical protein PR048_008731 [Dryococelus australis]|uniref:Uncharacterized protein n=1 Tax=Dryococelus australis TaxID=614101 RepID=A0ABQ9HXY7_9NEOP|nr:hypothetical protein PR048_008731 [Dryococelus australis]